VSGPDPDLGELARRAGGLRLAEVPAETRTHAAVVFADTVGVIMGGSAQPEVRRLLEADPPFAPGPGPSQVLLPHLPGVDPATAALVNGTAGTFLELDEGYRPTGHPAMHVVPAALAAAQALRRSGADLLAAVLSGYEVTARLFEAYRLTYPLHPHGHLGAVGAAVAVARLRGVDPREPALVAATLPLLTVWQPCYEGATARNVYTGLASAVGVLANRLAGAGFTGSRDALPVAFGELVGTLHRPAAITEPVDPGRLRIRRDYFKLHSACALNHSALDAVLALGVEAAQVDSVLVETVSNNLKLDRQPQGNSLSTRFSLPYAVAAALVHGHTGPEAFEPDPRARTLAERVTVRAAEDLEPRWPEAAPARVTVRLRDGSARAGSVDNPRGHHANPASPSELARKFERLCWARDPGALYERLLAVETEPDCAALFRGV
jgi:2-methylcitrate dehydratase PrpD